MLDCYAGIDPKGYCPALIPARIIKVKEPILSDRPSTDVLKKNDLYGSVPRDTQPSHNTFNTLRRRLGPGGFSEIHKLFVKKAHSLRTISGVPPVTLISPANKSDQDFIIVLIEELIALYPLAYGKK